MARRCLFCASTCFSFLLFVLLFCEGCTTTRQSLFSTSGPGWKIQQGQALWRPRREYPELGGDVVLATDEQGRCAIEFAKTPMSLVSAQTSSNEWYIRFTGRKKAFAGRGKPPARFAWLYLRAALSGEPLPSAFKFKREPAGDWSLENTESGETLKGFFAP
jgi:hypothetical protein